MPQNEMVFSKYGKSPACKKSVFFILTHYTAFFNLKNLNFTVPPKGFVRSKARLVSKRAASRPAAGCYLRSSFSSAQ